MKKRLWYFFSIIYKNTIKSSENLAMYKKTITSIKHYYVNMKYFVLFSIIYDFYTLNKKQINSFMIKLFFSKFLYEQIALLLLQWIQMLQGNNIQQVVPSRIPRTGLRQL